MSNEDFDTDKEDILQPQDDLDEDLQREIDEALGDGSIEDLIDAEEGAAPPAGLRQGTVVAIHGEDIFVDLGGRSQGVLPVGQFEDDPVPAVGDTIEVVIAGFDQRDGLLILSRKGAILAAAWETLEEGQIVEGRVTGHNKGGLELDLQGVSAFMPISQIDRFRVEDLKQFLNQRMRCEVIEIKRATKSAVVSRRTVQEREAAEAREKMFEALAEGQVVPGTVKTIMPYGAFVDIGGIDGLLHVKEMSHGYVKNPADLVSEGQQLTVMVLKIDRDERKIALGLKQVLPDPWVDAEAKWSVNQIVTGRVTRLADFGAFVQLEEGVEGLIPISELTYERRLKHPGEIVSEDQVVQLRVLNVDSQAKRIGLSLKQVGEDPWMGASVRWPANSLVEGLVRRVTDFGAFVELAPGVEGLVHISEISESRIRSVADKLQVGQTVQAMVISVDEDAQRMSLSIKQAAYMSKSTDEAAEPKPEPKAQRKRKKPLRGGLDY